MVKYMTSINNFSNKNNIEELDVISKQINYGLHLTIIKQLGSLKPELETKYASQLLKKFINGNLNAFTNENNVRANIKSINSFKIIILLIKSAIERYAFNIVKLKKVKMKNNEDKVSETITEQIAGGNFEEIFNWINTDNRIMDMLIENYINLYYHSDDTLIEAYTYITKKSKKADEAMQQLNSKLKLKNSKSK